jgi:hypothetical protein
VEEKSMARVTGVCAVVVICVWMTGCGKPSGQVAPFGKAAFEGQWVPDFDRTMEEARKSPKYQPGDEKVSAMLKRTLESMQLEVTADALVFSRGGRKQSLAYTVISTDPEAQSLTVSTGGDGDKGTEVTLRLLEGGFLNFKSAGSDDMDYFIWKRVPAAD